MPENIKKSVYKGLRWTEHYTRTDMVYLTTGGFWLSLKTGIIMMLSLCVSIAFANLLPQQIYGEYKYVFSLFGLLAIPTLIGMSNAITRSVALGYDGTPVEALKTKMMWGTLGSLASLCIGAYYYLNGNIILGGGFAVVALFLPFVDTLGIFNSVLTGKKLFKLSTLYEIIIQGASSVAVVSALLLTNNLIAILASYFVSMTLTRLAVFHRVMRYHAENKNVDPEGIRYGKHLSSMEIPSLVAEALDNILLWQFVGAAPLAIYAFAKGIPAQVNIAAQRIITLAFPKFAQRDYASIKKTLVHKMLLMFFLMLCVVAAYWIAAPYIFKIFFPQYMESVFYSQIFALTLLFFPQKFIGTAFQAHAKTRALYISTTVVPFARIIFALILIPLYGIPGVLIVEFSARTINFCILTYQFARSHA